MGSFDWSQRDPSGGRRRTKFTFVGSLFPLALFVVYVIVTLVFADPPS